jgi:SOS-response transcriptional repressor LexA
MAEDERVLYDRIEEYFSDFYQKYESERKGLGFVMTVYRRRLTSSFYAVEKSLELRLAFLKGQTIPDAVQGLTEEDLEQEDLSLDIGEEIEAQQATLFDQSPIVADFDEETVQRLRKRGFPFAPLFHLVDTKGLKPEPADPFWLKVQGKSVREIRGIEDHLRRQIKDLVESLTKLRNTPLEEPEAQSPSTQRFYEEVKRERPRLVLLTSPPPEQMFKRFLPVYSLKAAAGYFGEGEAVEPESWVEVDGLGTLDERMFVARAVGRSMEPRIQDSDYLVFRANPAGSRIGKIVLVQYRGPEDPETGGAYTVKKYESEKVPAEEGGWRHQRIVLKPLNPEFSPMCPFGKPA